MPDYLTDLNSLKASLSATNALLKSELGDKTTASYQFKWLKKTIIEFMNSLDDEHEIGLVLTSFGNSVTMIVDEINYIDPVLIVFKGFVGGEYSTLMQHVTQLNVLIKPIPKQDPEKPPRKIGFHIYD